MTTTEGAWGQSIPAVGRQIGETESFVSRLKRETGEAVADLGRIMEKKGLGGTVASLREGREAGNEVMGAARLMYELSQKWVRQDYNGFVTWLKQEAGVPQEQVGGYVEALNAEGDIGRMRQAAVDLSTWLRSGEEGVRPVEGESELLLMAGDIGAAAIAKGGGGDTGGDVAFPSGPEDKPPDEKEDKEDKKEAPPKTGEELALPGRPSEWTRERRQEQMVTPAADKPLKTTMGRKAAIGCLLTLICSCVMLTTPLGARVVSVLRSDQVQGVIGTVDSSVPADQFIAEKIVNRMFGEDGGDPDNIYIDVFLEDYEKAAREGDRQWQQAYGEAMVRELQDKGIITGDKAQAFDEEKLRQKLEGYGYSTGDIEGDIDRLVVWLRGYLAAR